MNIAIWGMGVSGISTLKYLSLQEDHNLYIINTGDIKQWKNINEIESLTSASRCNSYCYSEIDSVTLQNKLDLIILSPGINPKNRALDHFENVAKVCEVEFTSALTKVPIIAVTGTNGKTSTVTLIAKALEHAGKSVFLGGNIGVPFIEILLKDKKYDYAVLELSSFQLDLIDKFHPHISIILNIEASHMERYGTFLDYEHAKLNILKNLGKSDLFIGPGKLMGRNVGFEKKTISQINNIDLTKSKLIGDHHLLNFDVVAKVLTKLRINNKQKILQQLATDAEVVPFRLEYIKSIGDVKFYNDSKSTNTHSTVCALQAFPLKKICLIMGGSLRDESQELEKTMKSFSTILCVYSFGESARYIGKKMGVEFNVIVKNNLKEIVDDIELEDFDIVLFSPGFPSFDQYNSYIDRGNDFNTLVNKLP